MNSKEITFIIFLIFLVTFGLYGISYTSDKVEKQINEKNVKSEAKEIDASSAIISEDHPEIEEGITCSDCHEIKLDAKTTATQVWLTGDYANFSANEGVMPVSKVKEAIVRAMGRKKQSKTCVLATSLNDIPISTSAEFTLDQDNMVLHGIHEKGTAKLFHMKLNPRVSLNWHKEFETWGKIFCIQFSGSAELVEGNNPEFDRILKEVIPYEESARARKVPLDKCRDMYKQMMVISKITIEEATITSTAFKKEGNYRPWQRWKR